MAELSLVARFYGEPEPFLIFSLLLFLPPDKLSLLDEAMLGSQGPKL